MKKHTFALVLGLVASGHTAAQTTGDVATTRAASATPSREVYPRPEYEKSNYANEVYVDITCAELLKRAEAQDWHPGRLRDAASEEMKEQEVAQEMMTAANEQMAAAKNLMEAAKKQEADAKRRLAKSETPSADADLDDESGDASQAMANADAAMATAKEVMKKAIESMSLATLAEKKSAKEIAAVMNARAAMDAATKMLAEASTPGEANAARVAMEVAAADAVGDTDNEAMMTTSEMAVAKLDELENRAAEARYLRHVWDALGTYPVGKFSTKSWGGVTLTQGDKLLEIREEISRCAQITVLEAQKAAALPAAIDSKDIDQIRVKTVLDAAEGNYRYVAKRTLFDQSQLGLFIGPSYALDSGDKFKTGVETLAIFDGGAGSLFGIGRAITEISYRSNGSVNFAGPIPPLPPVTDPPAAEITESDLYRADPGYARINIGASTSIADRYSLALVGGLTAIPGLNDSFPKALRPRGEFTMLGRSFYGTGVYSRISAGYAYDTYWRNAVVANPDNLREGTTLEKSYHRAIVQALVMLPMPGISPEFAVAGRLSVDTPINGNGPSEVRLSILASMDFAKFFASLTPQAATTGN